jgi:hypothetical protein
MNIIWLSLICGFLCLNLFGFKMRGAPQDLTGADTSITTYNQLTASNKNSYVLKVRLGNYGKDSCGNYAYGLHATIDNRTDDTLKYLDWTCEHFIWKTNNTNVWAVQPMTLCDGCLKNIMSVCTVPPHKQVIVSLRSGFSDGTQTFRLGMILQRVIRNDDWLYYFRYFDMDRHKLQNQKQNVIWSNAIKIPY